MTEHRTMTAATPRARDTGVSSKPGWRPLRWCAVLLLGVACHSAPSLPPFELPDLELATTHRVGGLLTDVGAAPETAELKPDDCLSVHVRWFVLREVDETFGPRGLSGAGIASRAELIARVGGQRVLSPTPRLAGDAKLVLPGSAQDPVAVMEELLGHGGRSLSPPLAALPPGTTAEFDLADPAAALRVARGEPGTGGVRVLVHRPPVTETETAPATAPATAGLRVALGMIGWLPAPALETEGPLEVKGRKPIAESGPTKETVEAFREVVVLEDAVQVDGPPLVIALPMEFASGAAQGLAAVVWVTGAPAPESAEREAHAEAFQRFVADLESSDAGEPAVSPVFIGLTEAFVGLEVPSTQRTSLSHLAHQTGAQLAADLSLVVDDEILAVYVERVMAALPSGPPLGDAGSALGWELERQALILFSERLAVPDPNVVLEAVLLRRLGETARHPSYVKRLADRVPDLAALDEICVQQNILWLEDPSPAARIRAHDWLLARGLVPPGFDPLGSRDQRRAALASYREVTGS